MMIEGRVLSFYIKIVHRINGYQLTSYTI